MGTLIKRKGLFPSIVKKSVNNFFDDYITKDLFDWTDENFAESGSKIQSVNLKEIDTNNEVALAVPKIKKENFKFDIENDIRMISSEKEAEKEEARKNDSYARKGFNYQSFCRLPNY